VPTTGKPSAPLPSGQGDQSTACAPNVGAAPTSYPGWPGGDQAVATNEDVIPFLAMRDLAVGPNRFLVTIVDNANQVIAAPGIGVKLRFFNLAADPNNPTSSPDAFFLDAGNGKGLYRSNVDFACWGDWGVELTVEQASRRDTARVVFDVQATSSTPAIGEAAPAVETPTATDAAGIAAISTDPDPDPDWYGMTIAQAVTSGRPSLIVFATPAFCQTATCGPTLSLVKSAAAPYKGRVNLLHVEPYILQTTPTGLQPVLDPQGRLQAVAAADDFGLISEPFTFVVDSAGKVAAKFAGLMDPVEIRAALDAVTTGTPVGASPGASAAP
jgi:hypothetical protein